MSHGTPRAGSGTGSSEASSSSSISDMINGMPKSGKFTIKKPELSKNQGLVRDHLAGPKNGASSAQDMHTDIPATAAPGSSRPPAAPQPPKPPTVPVLCVLLCACACENVGKRVEAHLACILLQHLIWLILQHRIYRMSRGHASVSHNV